MSTTMNRAECGYRRRQARFQIRAALDAQDMTMATIARRLGVTPEAVQATVSGKNHSTRVLDALRSVGVPEKYLFDPRKMRAEVA